MDETSLLTEKVHIQDAFRYLVANGTCVARYVDNHWLVSLNGRLYSQIGTDPTLYVFVCETEHGTVRVQFLHSAAE